MANEPQNKIRVLLIDDDPTQRIYIRKLLEQSKQIECSLDWVASFEEAIEAIEAKEHDVYLVDHYLGEFEGTDLISRYSSQIPVSFILWTSEDSQEVDNKAMKAGAMDYLVKSQISPSLLSRTIRYAIERKRVEIRWDQLNRKLEAANNQMLEDLEQARKTQMELNPKTLPQRDYLKSAIRYIPHSHVSGDMYDIRINDAGQCVFFLGDATGHGTSAALITMMAKLAIQQTPSHVSTHQIVARINDQLAGSMPDGKMITGAYGILFPDGRLRMTNAGHPPIVILSKRHETLQTIEASGPPLGFFAEMDYEEEQVHLHHGDKLFMLTDGILEACNPEGELFDQERFYEILQKYKYQSLDEILDKIFEVMYEFTQDTPIDDDLTVLGIEYLDPLGLGEKASIEAEEQRLLVETAIQQLKHSRFLVGVSEQIIDQLAPFSEVREYSDETVILQEGSENYNVFILLKGSVDIQKEDVSLLQLQRTGDVFGEISVLNETKCTASVVALGACRILVLRTQEILFPEPGAEFGFLSSLYRLFAGILGEKLTMTSRIANERANELSQTVQELKKSRQIIKKLSSELDKS